MEAILSNQSRVPARVAVAKPIASAIAIGTGAPFGAEGPIIVTGGSIGSLIGQVIRVSPAERKILLASGAAAGMAATFGAPLAAVVLAIELLLFEFSTRAFVPLVVAASVAGGMHAWLFGSGPLFTVPRHDFAGLELLPLFVVLGVLCGVLAAVVAKGLFVVEHAYRRLPVSEFWHPLIGAVGFAAVGLLVPRALGVGYDAIGGVLVGGLGAGTLATLLVAKLVAWWLALGSGTSGGTLAPLLLIGGAFGALLGTGAAELWPGWDISPGAFALVAMAATFGAATRATFASIVFLFELTRDYEAILPLMLATVVAGLVCSALIHESLMTEKLSRRGLLVRGDYHLDVWSTVDVGRLMTLDVRTVPVTATVAEVRRLFEEGGHGAYPVVDGFRCVGIVSRSDLLLAEPEDGAGVMTVASRDVVSVRASSPAAAALATMLEEHVEHLPVVESGVLVGICTRTDLLRARSWQLEQERGQPGWRPRRPGRDDRVAPPADAPGALGAEGAEGAPGASTSGAQHLRLGRPPGA
jgi:H+/Cl- antiporter ClcA